MFFAMVDMKEMQRIASLLPQWAAGTTSLKDIKGYSDEELYAIAHTAYFFIMQGKNAEAKILFEGLVAIDPRNDYYYRALGVIFHKLGDPERAIKQFGYAIRVNPRAPAAYINRAEVFVSLGRKAEALPDLRRALDVATSDADAALVRKARALLDQAGPLRG